MPPTSPLHQNQPIPDLVENLARNIQHLPSRFILPLQHRPTSPSFTADAQIPVIDMSGLQNESLRPQILAQIHRASAEWGVFQVINHGVPVDALHRLKQEVEGFFALPIDERIPVTAVGNQGQGYGSGFVRPETGVTEWRDFCRLLVYPESKRDYSMWPKGPAFREAVDNYSREARTLLWKLLACASENLGLPPCYIEESLGEIHQNLLINYYPPCPHPNLVAGISEHTDIGVMTCLWQSGHVVGLHVLKDKNWVPVRLLDNALTIVVADQLEILSNGLYKSVHHRAVVNAKDPRISVVSFYHLKPDAVVCPAPELINADHPALYLPTRFGDHSLKQANPYRKTECVSQDRVLVG